MKYYEDEYTGDSLVEATKDGNYDELEGLLSEVNVDDHHAFGQTALHVAVILSEEGKTNSRSGKNATTPINNDGVLRG